MFKRKKADLQDAAAVDLRPTLVKCGFYFGLTIVYLIVVQVIVAAIAEAREPGRSGPRVYIEPKAGITFFELDLPDDVIDTDTDTGFAIGGAVGLRSPGSGFRAEAEVLHQRAGFELGPSGDHIGVTSFMANGYYDFRTNGPVTPYIGGGVGVARVGVDITGFADDSDTAFAYNGQAGFKIDLYRGGQFTVGYRYTGLEDTEIDGLFGDLEASSHTVQAGYRLPF